MLGAYFMKFCEKCGKEIMDEAVICPNCGCSTQSSGQTDENTAVCAPASKAAVILGIIGIVGGVLLAIVGHICSIIAIILGIIDCTKKRKPTGLIIGIIGEVVSIISSIIGAVVMTNMF